MVCIELAERIIDLNMNIHAWSCARPILQTEKQAHELESSINNVIAVESEQGEYSDSRSSSYSVLSFAGTRRLLSA